MLQKDINKSDPALCHALEIVFFFSFFCKNHIIWYNTFLQKAWHLEIRGRTTQNYICFLLQEKIHFFTVIKKRLKKLTKKLQVRPP